MEGRLTFRPAMSLSSSDECLGPPVESSDFFRRAEAPNAANPIIAMQMGPVRLALGLTK